MRKKTALPILLLCLSVSGCGILGGNTVSHRDSTMDYPGNLSPREEGEVVGGAVGAGTGAVIGSEFGNTGAGVAIGAATGVVSGAVAGDATVDRSDIVKSQEEILRRQDVEIERQKRDIEDLKRQKLVNGELKDAAS